MIKDKKIAIIGLGYVGLPLAIEFGNFFKVVGFDVNKSRVEELVSGIDRTQEADINRMKSATSLSGDIGLKFSSNVDDLIECDIFIVIFRKFIC